MAGLKTKPNEQSVDEFLETVADQNRREDCLRVLEIMRDVTGEAPKMWGGRRGRVGTSGAGRCIGEAHAGYIHV